MMRRRSAAVSRTVAHCASLHPNYARGLRELSRSALGDGNSMPASTRAPTRTVIARGDVRIEIVAQGRERGNVIVLLPSLGRGASDFDAVAERWATAATSERRRKIFGMDEDLVVARHGSIHPFAFEIDGDDVVRRHLLRDRCWRASSESARRRRADGTSRVRRRNRPGPEHAGRVDEYFSQTVGHVRKARRALPL